MTMSHCHGMLLHWDPLTSMRSIYPLNPQTILLWTELAGGKAVDYVEHISESLRDVTALYAKYTTVPEAQTSLFFKSLLKLQVR